MSDAPTELHSKAGGFVRRPDLYALRVPAGNPPLGALARMQEDAQTLLAVYQGSPPEGADVGPVYATSTGGQLAVPTGRVFVRLRPPLHPAEVASEFARAGFEIHQTLAYAPHAVWLRPSTGRIASALTGLPALEQLDAVEHVEPQLLLERAWKD